MSGGQAGTAALGEPGQPISAEEDSEVILVVSA
jgi:hypothetical protein